MGVKTEQHAVRWHETMLGYSVLLTLIFEGGSDAVTAPPPPAAVRERLLSTYRVPGPTE